MSLHLGKEDGCGSKSSIGIYQEQIRHKNIDKKIRLQLVQTKYKGRRVQRPCAISKYPLVGTIFFFSSRVGPSVLRSNGFQVLLFLQVIDSYLGFSCAPTTRAFPHLIFDLPPNFLERLFLGFCERELGRNWVSLGDKRLLLLVGQNENTVGISLRWGEEKSNN